MGTDRGEEDNDFVQFGAYKDFDYMALVKEALKEAILDICSLIIPRPGAAAPAAAAPGDGKATAPGDGKATQQQPRGYLAVVDKAADAATKEKAKRGLPKVDQDEVDDDDLMARRRKVQAQEEAPSHGADPVQDEIDLFFSQAIVWEQTLKQQSNITDNSIAEKIGTTAIEHQENWMAIADLFDPMKWWTDMGRHRFPLIYWVAIVHMSLPDSNGHQERTFSAAQWMDDLRRTTQHDATFEMKVIIYKNQEFLAALNDRELKKYTMLARKATKEIFEEAERARDDEDDFLSDSDEEDKLFSILEERQQKHEKMLATASRKRRTAQKRLEKEVEEAGKTT